jgi:Fe2+ or Zn2+ uptake regulation protein
MPRSLVDMIRLYTGYDATTEPAFELHDHLRCGRCGKVTRLIPIEGVVAVWKSPALSSGLAIVDEVSEPTRGSHRGVRVIR